MKKYRAVVIGCGKIGALYEAEKNRTKPATHAGALVRNPKTELVACADPNARNRTAAKKLFPSVKYYDSAAACIKAERPDIVAIATPPSVRLPIIRECVKAGVKMIICEKPLALNIREARAIQKLLGKSKTVFVLNYQRRFSPLFKRTRDDIDSGKLGAIQQITCYYSNGLYNNGGHIIDALLYLLGNVPKSVVGFTNKENKTHPIGDSNVDGYLFTKEGTPVAMQSFDQNTYGIFDIHILGTKGSVLLTNYGQRLIRTPARESEFVGVKQLDSKRTLMSEHPLSATEEVLIHAIDCFEHGKKPESSIASGIGVLKILDALEKSARNSGRRILV